VRGVDYENYRSFTALMGALTGDWGLWSNLETAVAVVRAMAGRKEQRT
jgi:hypothetical protein